MQNILDYLSANATGILMLLLVVFIALYALNNIVKIFGWGRYKRFNKEGDKNSPLYYGVSVFFVNLINDFKHLLALVIVIIFTGLIIYSMAAGTNFDEKLDALKLVIASLGGLLGSIIGYYFGESAARGVNSTTTTISGIQASNEDTMPDNNNVIMPAPEINEDPAG